MNRLAGLLFALPLAAHGAGCASQPAYEPNPYSADQIVRLLRGAISPERILFDAGRECISFRITSDVQVLFTDAGAPPSFAEALRSACYHAPRDAALHDAALPDPTLHDPTAAVRTIGRRA
jgi:hypothetical protein